MERLTIAARNRIYADFIRYCRPSENDTIIDVGVADGGERQPVGVERARDLLRQHRLVRVEPGAQQLAEAVRELDRL